LPESLEYMSITLCKTVPVSGNGRLFQDIGRIPTALPKSNALKRLPAPHGQQNALALV
jgi:hypothetical protein